MNINFNAVLNTIAAKAKALALNVTEIELKVLEATNEEPWGPHGKDMQEIARAADDPEKYNLIMNVISERLQMRDENWRLCYKALLLLEFMVKHGPWRVVDELQRSVSSLERLRDDFEYKDPQGRDQGVNVRQRAGELAALVCNVDRVRQEREKAARNANKFRGVSSADVRGGFGSTNYSSGGGTYGYSGFGSGFGGGGGSSGFGGSGGNSGFGGSGGNSGFGGKSGNGSRNQGCTESVHMPSSHQNRSGYGSSHTAGSAPASAARLNDGFRAVDGTGGGGGDEAEDPFEATRKRIERLKAEGALQESASAGAPPGLVDPAANAKAPKKLSDVKINPAVAATFANISVPASNSAPSLAKLMPPPGMPLKAASAQQDSGDSLDLFGEQLLDTQPAAQQLSGPVATGLDWDAAFGAAGPNTASSASAVVTPAAAAPADPFADFAGAAPMLKAVPSPAAAPSGGFDALFGGGPPGGSVKATSASARPQVRAPLPLDDFAEFADPKPSAAPLATGLPSLTASSAASTGDPFATLASSSSAALAPQTCTASAAACAAATAPGGDPFAALSAARAAAPGAMVAAAKPAAVAPVAFDAFGAAPPPPAWTPKAAAAAADPFAALASSSAPAPVPMAAAARPPPQAAAEAFDPFVSAPAARPIAPGAAFDAFGSAAVPSPQPVTSGPGASSFDDFFGTGSAGQAGPGRIAASSSSAAEPFMVASFPAPPPPPAPTAAAAPAAGTNGAAMAMNKTGAAHGAAVHKNADPFAGLGF